MNLVLSDSVEMSYPAAGSADGCTELVIGSCVLRGDDVAYVALVDTMAEAGIDRLQFTAD